jgi:hypothetical protein
MSETNVVSIVDSLSEAGASDRVIYTLAAIGINVAHNSYRHDKAQLLREFSGLPGSVVAEMWEALDDRIKIHYVNENVDLFREWLKDGR